MEEYSDLYYNKYHKNWFENPNLNLFERISEVINGKVQVESVIEIGCGKGDFLKYLRNNNPILTLTGIDITKNDDMNGIKFIQSDAFNIKLDKKYDVVVTLAVIEHMPDPIAYVELLKNLCAENGFIIIMTLNDRSILYQLSRLLKKLGINKPYQRLYDKHHLNHFNHSSLNKLLDMSGLSSIRTINHNISYAAIDTGVKSAVLDLLVRLSVMVIFLFGLISKQTYLQTVICEKK